MRSNLPPDLPPERFPSGIPARIPSDIPSEIPPPLPPEPGQARQAAPAAAGAPFIALVGLSARMLAQSARRAGLRVVALDLFGDRDTRRASKLWIDIGDSEALAIDRDRLAEALGRVAALPRMMGWIGASGSEILVPELAARAGLPRHLGNSAQAIAAVRDPQRFFPLLDSLRIDHPAVAFHPPETPAGWLYKHRDGCGGWHIRPAPPASAMSMPASALSPLSPLSPFSRLPPCAVPEGGYFQRLAPGRSLSALFVAAGGRALRIGAAEQTSTAIGAHPFIYTGALGPLELAPRVALRLDAAIAAIVARTGLVGLNSIDCLLDGDTLQVLEINPRPSATLGLYEEASALAWPAGLVAVHLDACLQGVLPRRVPRYGDWRVGARTVFAPHAFVASANFSNACIMDAGIRDVPMPGTPIAAGQPVCTALARTSSLPALRDALERRAARLLQQIAHSHENRDDIVQFPG